MDESSVMSRLSRLGLFRKMGKGGEGYGNGQGQVGNCSFLLVRISCISCAV